MMQWFEERLGLKSVWGRFWNKPVPEKTGWPHVLGSVLLFLLILQAVTGILLSFVYAPSPLSAHRSLQFLIAEQAGGEWIRSIHHGCASALVIVACLHILRTFVHAAYRKPREMTWIAGVLLFLAVLAFGQTGYLLAWDQRAYWGTTVTVRIISAVPLIGSTLARILCGGDNVGALTLSRFYSIHTIVLPAFTSALIILHLFLIRRFGVATPPGNERNRNLPFYPFQTARDAFAISMAIGSVLLLAWMVPAPLGSPADPADNTFVPRPDWYFLFLFQLLRLFSGDFEIIGTFILPATAVSLLLLLPFLDRNQKFGLRNRPVAAICMFTAVTGWGWLTYSAVSEMPPPSTHPPGGLAASRTERIKRPAEIGGLYLLKQHCFECHSMTVLGDRPDLQTLTRRKFPAGREWLHQHLLDENRSAAFTEKETQELMSALRLTAGDRPELLYTIPLSARFGAHMFYNKACTRCHQIDGQGGEFKEVPAPDLTFRRLKTRRWHMQHIKDSQTLVRDSKMPPFLHYEEYEYRALADYILYLHTP